MSFIFFILGHHELRSDRLEDVTHLLNTILSPIVVQVYEFHEFHEKSEKLKNKKLWITLKMKVTKKFEWENLQGDNYHAHSTGTFRTQSSIWDGAFCEHG